MISVTIIFNLIWSKILNILLGQQFQYKIVMYYFNKKQGPVVLTYKES